MGLKPIHKYNGGIGATLCHKCNVIINTGFTDDLYCEEHGGKPNFKYKLVRSADGLTKYSNKITWVQWNENGTFKNTSDDIVFGASLVLDFSMGNYQWMTTSVVSFEKEGNVINFKTKNSEYVLTKN